MTPSTKSKVGKVAAREAVVGVVGARPPIFRTTIVRNRHTGKLVEVPLAPMEAPPLDEGDPGVSYVFKRGEEIPADHPAALASPGSFYPVEE
jgi:hypothetical protein